MLKIKLLSIACITCLAFASCTHVYSPALYHQDIAYQPKPMSMDTVRAANYVSLAYNSYSNVNYSDNIESGQLNISRAYVFKGWNLAYGAFGSFGDYEDGSNNKTTPDYFTDKYFGAVGGRASANLYVNSGRADIRFLGVEMAYSHEFGPYADYRKSLAAEGGYYVDPRTDLFTVGLTSEVIFRTIRDNGFQHGIRVFLGTTLGHNDLDDTYYAGESSGEMRYNHIFPRASYFINFKNYFGTFEVGDGAMIRFGYKF
jgi:hypothetical protein